ncbi:hypothetical protein IP84_03465 [beta proteobacterium AAP99]|nr:hypothetical protein IP84_03465 [beta proteobacterium AAP99]
MRLFRIFLKWWEKMLLANLSRKQRPGLVTEPLATLFIPDSPLPIVLCELLYEDTFRPLG